MYKICYLADANSIHTRKWVNFFADLNYEIHLISMREPSFRYGSNVYLHVIKPPFGSKLSYLFIINSVKKLVSQIAPDILHSHYATSYGLFGRMCNFHPFIISVWGSDIYEFPKGGFPNIYLLKYILSGADRICSTSADMAKETSKYINKEIILTPFGVDIEKFRLKEPILKNELVTIGVVKGLEKIYGINYLIQGFADVLKSTDTQLRLMIVGDGSEKKSLQEQCRELDIFDKVIFTGSIENNKVADYINMMDIVCLPSLSESFGVSAVEACACGRPIICTGVGGLKEIIFDGYNGYMVNVRDSNDIKDKIQLMISDRDKMYEFSRNARKLVEEKYNWLNNAEIMNELYNDIVT